MSDYNNPLYHRNLYFPPEQQDLLNALASPNMSLKDFNGSILNNPSVKQNHSPPHELFDSPSEGAPGSGHLDPTDDSPYPDYPLDQDYDAAFGDLADFPDPLLFPEPELGEKRKGMGEKDDDEVNGKKRKESEDKTAKKPGRKPLTSEPTSKRKMQNRAAQRAFRERKEKHLKDLETKVEEMEKVSEATSNENTLLRTQVERLQVELKEYRKRLSWMSSGNSVSSASSLNGRATDPRRSRFSHDFSFEFPKFGDLPAHMFNNTPQAKSQSSSISPLSSAAGNQYKAPGILSRDALKAQSQQFSSTGGPSSVKAKTNPGSFRPFYETPAGINQLSGFSRTSHKGSKSGSINGSYTSQVRGSSDASNTNSPSASSESQQSHQGPISSVGTSPEPFTNSPSTGKQDLGPNHKSGKAQLPLSESLRENPSKELTSPNNTNTNDGNLFGFDWFAQQNGGQFDPILFGDYREPQDAVLTQDFGDFFNDAFSLPDFGDSLEHTNTNTSTAPKPNLISQIDKSQDAEEEEVVPGEDRTRMMTCSKIWDRLQTMDKFRSGEIDVDNLCTELRTKARCSEGGAVVDQTDVDDIFSRAK